MTLPLIQAEVWAGYLTEVALTMWALVILLPRQLFSVWAAAAPTMKPVPLELGGKSSTVISADADVSRAVPGAAAAVFFNSGQICTVGSRLLIDAAVYEEVIAGGRAGSLQPG